jgi:hypothetical protein
MKALRLDKLAEFIAAAQKAGPASGRQGCTNDTFIVYQLLRFAEGHRGVELHDLCISLIEGEVEVPASGDQPLAQTSIPMVFVDPDIIKEIAKEQTELFHAGDGNWTLTLTSAFAAYTGNSAFAAGDQIYIDGGTGCTAGWYTIASRTSNDVITITASLPPMCWSTGSRAQAFATQYITLPWVLLVVKAGMGVVTVSNSDAELRFEVQLPHGFKLTQGIDETVESTKTFSTYEEAWAAAVADNDLGVEDAAEFHKTGHAWRLGKTGTDWISIVPVSPQRCERCGSNLVHGYCESSQCFFGEHFQSCPRGWMGHDQHPTADAEKCICDTLPHPYTHIK